MRDITVGTIFRIYYTITCETISPANICKLLIVAPAFKSTIYFPTRWYCASDGLCYGSCIIFGFTIVGALLRLEAYHNETYSTWRPTLIAVVVVTHFQITATSLLAFSGGIPSVSCDVIQMKLHRSLFYKYNSIDAIKKIIRRRYFANVNIFC